MILEAGHTIGNHTQTHPRFSFLAVRSESAGAGNRRIRSDNLFDRGGRADLVSCPGRVEESVPSSDSGRTRPPAGRLERQGI